MIPRFYCPLPLTPLSHGAQIELPAAAAHHALRVLRLKLGAPLILFDGRGGEWQAAIVGAGETVRVALQAFDSHDNSRDNESPLTITLVQALPAGDKMDWVIEKAVELGVSAIQPVAAKRCVVKLTAERALRRVAHWNQIVRAACEQCGRNRLPLVAPLLDLPQYLTLATRQNAGSQVDGNLAEDKVADSKPAVLRLLLAPETGVSLHDLVKPDRPIVILIGPEGGWDAGEMQAMQAAGFQAQPLRLGPRVLRTETAGLAVLAALQARWGDF